MPRRDDQGAVGFVHGAATEVDDDGVEIIRTSHGVVPSQWIRRLPCLIRAFVVFIYCELLRPDDDFRQELRKIVLVFGPLCTGTSASVMLVNWWTLESDWSFAATASRLNSMILLITWWTSYIMCRVTGRASAVIADIWVFGTWFGLMIVAVTYHDYPLDQAFVLVLIIAMLARTPRLPLHAVLNLLAVALTSYNNAAYSRGEPDVVLLADPGSLMRGVGVRMFFTALSYGSVVIVLAGLQLQLLESDRQTEQANANSDVAAELAGHLGDYNTRQAEAVVARAESERTADPTLLQAFRVLIDNLDRYRPHLPNWMLRSQDGSVEDDEGTIHPDDQSTQVSNRDGRAGSRVTRSTTQSEQSVLSRHSKKSSQQQQQHPAAQIGQLAPNVIQSASAVLAQVHFTHRHTGDGAAKPSRQRVADAVCGLADRVHQLARSTGGAVHSFVGDVVVVSWNAAARVIQPEMKAVRFLLRLREDAGDADITVGGAAFAGQTRVQLAGSAGAQAALTVHARWYGALGVLAALGRALGAFVVDTGFKSQVEYGAVVRPAAAVCVGEWRDSSADANDTAHNHDLYQQPPMRVLVAHELVNEVAEGNDEWMYVLDKATAAVTGAAAATGAKSPTDPKSVVVGMQREAAELAVKTAAAETRHFARSRARKSNAGDPNVPSTDGAETAEGLDAGAAAAQRERLQMICDMRSAARELLARLCEAMKAAVVAAGESATPEAAATVASIENLIGCVRHTLATAAALSAETLADGGE